ncbi:hypothetical protein SAMN04487912_105289 [Arthrobacter sp. cf158]|uniref:hypothetical protein n=1 Tax=Arthrobacter sp. cf158 TaxID=1761744 RepID=UPI000895141B|nr:hypothetical protein [Arthrobacter sp. cf158]SDW89941.1 hypothetical protein SAMN04487912_105289 [Arthrobacter sp. cf158]
MSHNSLSLVTSAVFSITDNDISPLASLEVTVEEPGSRDEKLNHAVDTLMPAALERKQGILVIQRDYGKYVVRVDQDVPCGVTQESPSSRLANRTHEQDTSAPTV